MKLELMYWGYSRADSTLNVKSHRHDYWQASLARSGRCRFVVAGDLLEVSAGEILLIPPGVEHSLRYCDDAPYESYTFKFKIDAAPEQRLTHWPDSVRSRALLSAVDGLMRAFFPVEKFGDPQGTVVLPGERHVRVIEGLLSGLLEYELAAEHDEHSLAARVRARLRLRPRSGVAEVAEALGCSRNHFSQRLKRESGLSAKEFFDRELVEAARRYLECSDLAVGEIALRLGFSDVFAFDAFFKRCTGRTPGECRRKRRA